MAKIAATAPVAHRMAEGAGWSVDEVICSSGPRDRPYEEQHDRVAIAIVTAGSFQYRASGAGPGRELMTPGSVLLGSPGQYFECGHEHAVGDRCVSFRYTPEYFESIAELGWRSGRRPFGLLRIPPVRELAPLIARAAMGTSAFPIGDLGWEELAVTLAAQAVRLDAGRAPSVHPVSAAALARVTRTIRAIDDRSGDRLTLAALARVAGLSPYHFLRTFESLTGVTPHQYVLRVRLRQAASRLVLEPVRILDVALDSGFGDVSNFNRAFRAEFGVSPRVYRRGEWTDELASG